MKRFLHLVVAIMALLAYSCTTDPTDNLGINVGDSDCTVISLSLNESRTQLGEKADNYYPLYWSEGDRISLNGVTSSALTAQQCGDSNARFTITGLAQAPYCIAYPAAPADQVLFAEKQSHTSNSTFGNGVTTMYAYGNDSSLSLQHLTGVLKFGVKGSAKLTLAQISTVDRKPIAGAFDFDFAKGEATATTASKDVIEYKFGEEGVQLSDEATYLHVAVPAGEYDELYVTLYDAEGGVMYATIKAGESKPLNAGAVREFASAIKYAPNSSVFVIKDKASLLDFASQAKTLDKDALFVADVDMSGETWEPIDGYSKTIIGNGYAIKGLTAPLFGATNASFKGLHLRDVNINETANPNVGALARNIVAVEGNIPVVSHCSVSGNLTVNVQGFVPAKAEVATDGAAGGLIGYIYGVKVSDCVNNATIELKQLFSASTSLVVLANGGGIVGYAQRAIAADGSTTISTATIEDCENNGIVSFTNASTDVSISPRIGGLIGYAAMNVVGNNLVNNGDISLCGPFGSTHTDNIGGVIGLGSSMTLNNSRNNGAISCSGGEFGTLRIGGVAGAITNCAGTQLHNYGVVSTASGVQTYKFLCGGTVGDHTGIVDIEFSILSNCSNNAAVTVNSSMKSDDTTATGGYFHVGGTIGWSQNNDHDIVNNAAGVLTVKSTLINAEDNAYNLSIGGCIGYQTQNGSSNITNHAAMDVHCTVKTLESYTAYDKVRLNIGGGIGYANANGDPMSAINNSGDISVYAHAVGCLRVGGSMAQTASGEVSNSVNSGKITIKEGTTTVNDLMMIGGNIGCVGGTAAKTLTNTGNIIIEKGLSCGNELHLGGNVGWTNKALTTLRNSGNITLQGGTVGALSSAANDAKLLNLGGNVGWVDVKLTMKDMENSGDITLNGLVAKYTMSVAGNVARYNTDTGGSGTNLKNSGAITIDEKSSTNGGLYVGGCVGIHQLHNSGALNTCENDAPITLKPSVSGNVYVGGVTGYVDGSTDRTLTNTKNGKVLVALAKTVAGKTFAVGGVAGRMVDHSNPLANYGDVDIKGTVKANAFIAGIVGYPNNYNRVNITNDCTITLDAEFTAVCRVGGICGGGSYGSLYGNAHNAGKIHATKNSKFKGETYIGGFFGEAKSEYLVLNYCSNSAEILFEGTSGSGGAATASLSLGGMFGSATILKSVQHGYTNNGNITFKGTHSSTAPLNIGGIIGHSEIPLEGTAFPVYEKGITTKVTEDGVEKTVTGPIYYDCKVVNKGDVKYEGKSSAGPVYVGGWAGYTTTPFLNAEVLCSVSSGSVTNAGMLMGIPYAEATKATKSQVGGSLNSNTLDASNYFSYIYSAPIEQSVATADECTYKADK